MIWRAILAGHIPTEITGNVPILKSRIFVNSTESSHKPRKIILKLVSRHKSNEV